MRYRFTAAVIAFLNFYDCRNLSTVLGPNLSYSS